MNTKHWQSARSTSGSDMGEEARPTMRLRTKAAAFVGAGALVGAAMLGLTAQPAAAEAGNCSSGLNTATTAWGHCDSVSNDGYNGFRLVVNCYYYPQQISYGSAPQSIYASCPSWSHVSGVFVEPWAG